MLFYSMRPAAVLLLLTLCFDATAQDQAKGKKPVLRFGFEVDQTTYPQKTPADAMKSIATAFDRKRVDYMLAHMIDPKYVDYWVKKYSEAFPFGTPEGKLLLGFDRLIRETEQYFQDDPLVVRELRVFAKEAEWNENEDTAVGVVKTIPTRKVFMRRVEGRWMLENKQQ